MGTEGFKQKTLKKKITLKGVGLHSGKKVRCVIHPAPDNHGIVFLRSDLSSKSLVKADISKVFKTEMNTTLGAHGVLVGTVEHLMAALSGMGVDNALVELSGIEVPILDGSSREFVDAISDSGLRSLKSNRKLLKLRQKISIQNGDKWIVAHPDTEFSVKGSISFKHGMIGEQVYQFSGEKDFRREVASARTFGFLREVDYLHKKGLALGASLENAVVLDEQRILNPEGLRYKNEFVRHKVLDAIGDFALLGMGIMASIEIHKSGHELHAAFLRKILDDPSNYEIVDAASSEVSVIGSSGSSSSGEAEEILPLVAAAAAY